MVNRTKKCQNLLQQRILLMKINAVQALSRHIYLKGYEAIVKKNKTTIKIQFWRNPDIRR